MESGKTPINFGDVVEVRSWAARPAALVVCEHASCRMPDALNHLGLSGDMLTSHIAWDPGALPVAEAVAAQLSAVLVNARVSRLVYDCNRPPDAPSAIPERSEVFDIPGNARLSAAQREERISQVYEPFRDAVSDAIAAHKASLECLVTIHSFTPIYKGVKREVKIGILHGQDEQLARAMMADMPGPLRAHTRLNEPYSARDGVAHTLDLHGAGNGLLNVMVEIRNDLIRTAEAQSAMARALVPWITRAVGNARNVQAAS